MTKYKVSQAVMGELNALRDQSKGFSIQGMLNDISYTQTLRNWVYKSGNTRQYEQAVIDYVFSDADNFEVKTPTWVIVSKKASKSGYYIPLAKDKFDNNLKAWSWGAHESRAEAVDSATRITDPKLKDALLYANKGFEAIDVEE